MNTNNKRELATEAEVPATKRRCAPKDASLMLLVNMVLAAKNKETVDLVEVMEPDRSQYNMPQKDNKRRPNVIQLIFSVKDHDDAPTYAPPGQEMIECEVFQVPLSQLTSHMEWFFQVCDACGEYNPELSSMLCTLFYGRKVGNCSPSTFTHPCHYFGKFSEYKVDLVRPQPVTIVQSYIFRL